MIDTLELIFEGRPDPGCFREAFKKHDLKAEIHFLRGESPGTKFVTWTGDRLFTVIQRSNRTKILARPCRFKSLQKFIQVLTDFFGESIGSARIRRIDFAIDLTQSLEDLYWKVDFCRKQLVTGYSSRCGQPTGITAGAGTEVQKLYDRFKKTKGQDDHRRIEVCLTKKKIPAATLAELVGYDPKRIAITVFLNIRFFSISITSRDLTKARYRRQIEIKTLIDNIGYTDARRRLNRNRNFHRDYANLLKITPELIQPQDLLASSLNAFWFPELG
ncbi:MAG: hypothetical protein KDD51_07975 [Bdellovibrionales bacterium]|nr:hypothetical protein [Bdellovibrionales bacterium]